jgi:hypothetical protein
MKRYKCVSAWARNQVGDIIDGYTLRRYPPEIQERNFVEVKVSVPKPPKNVPEAVSEASESISKVAETKPEPTRKSPAKKSDNPVE